MGFLEDVAEYEKGLPTEPELVAAHDELTQRWDKAKRVGSEKEKREARHALRHARWYWRSIREADGFATQIARMEPGDAIAIPGGGSINSDEGGNKARRIEV